MPDSISSERTIIGYQQLPFSNSFSLGDFRAVLGSGVNMFLKDLIVVLTSSLLLLPCMLEEGAKLTDDDNGIGRWIKKQLHNTASPLFHWNKGEIREAIDRLKRTGEQASSSTEYPLCLLDVPEWLHFILRPVKFILLSYLGFGL